MLHSACGTARSGPLPGKQATRLAINGHMSAAPVPCMPPRGKRAHMYVRGPTRAARNVGCGPRSHPMTGVTLDRRFVFTQADMHVVQNAVQRFAACECECECEWALRMWRRYSAQQMAQGLCHRLWPQDAWRPTAPGGNHSQGLLLAQQAWLPSWAAWGQRRPTSPCSWA